MTVLQEGRARRPRRRPHRVLRRTGRALSVLLLAAVALLALMAARAQGPATIAPKTPLIPVHVKPAPLKPQRGSYGIAPAPADEQVAVKRGLRLRSGLLFDVNTGQVLWQKHPTQALPIASLTKMMTALVVASRAKAGDRVLITRDALHYTGSGVGLLPRGKRVSLTTLLYGLMLPSGNDAAIALADHVARTQTRFIGLMNHKAQQLGLRCTHFTTVSGIVDRGNYSCAQDLALIAHLVVKQPLLSRIVASRSAILPFPIKGGKLYLYNNNPLLLLRYPGVDGVKTGFTDAAGQCLVATARRGRTWLGVVLLHGGDTSTEAQQLLNAGFHRLRQS
ncbi:MAG TPA: serine hydrolase [Solirubrobacteraceae bacterium]|nr:serine hydrolase [Solirubrobacteraceae bacterium]